MKTAVALVVISAMVSAVSPKGVSHRPKTSTPQSLQKRSSGRRREQARVEKCKYLKPKGKGKGKTDRARRVRRREEFITQEVETVEYDQPILSRAAGNGKAGKGARPGFEWVYGEDDGSKADPNFDYVKCEAPSAQPSTSSSPSDNPSQGPSNSPSDSPSTFPSDKPSLSHQPSVSLQPSSSIMPSSRPSMSYSDFCPGGSDDPKNSDKIVKYAKDGTPTYTYEYQMVYLSNSDENELLNDVDEKLQEILSNALIWCGDSDNSNRRMSVLSRRALIAEADKVIDGISLNNLDAEVPNKQCSVPVDNGNECKVFQGDFTAYVRTGVNGQGIVTRENALAIILEEIKGAMDEDELVVITNAEKFVFGGGAESSSANSDFSLLGEQESNPKAKNNNITVLGGGIVGLTVCVILVFLFAATRKREHHNTKRVEQVIDDDESIFGKSVGRGTDVMSNGSSDWKYERGAHVFGEGDSVYSGHDGDDIVNDIKKAERRRLYGMGSRGTQLGPGEDNLGARGDSLDVHNCTSATCPICTGAKAPTFVNSDLLSPVEEVSPAREEASPESCPTPSYSNTVDVDFAERHYMSPDTVEM